LITRRSLLLAGGTGLLVAHPDSNAQPAPTVRRVGWVSFGSKTSPAEAYAAFRQGMHDLGWLEGKNVEHQAVYADGDASHLGAMAKELIRQRVDAIVVGNATTTRAMQRATSTIPIVMASVNNPVAAGFVASLAKPGGNITGITTQSEVVLGKLIAILHEIAPRARRIAFLLNESNPNEPVFWAAAQSACAMLDLTALRIVANAKAEFGAAVGEIVRQDAQAVVVVADPLYLNERAGMQTLMQGIRLPVAYAWREHVVAGGLLSYAADLAVTARHVATYVDKILKGIKPADLPVEQVNKFELVINLSAARTLGLTISKALLLHADEVIQ